MLGTASPVYEIVSGQILLSSYDEFCSLHRDELLPMLREAGVEPVLTLVTELGRYRRFLDVFRYPSLAEYGRRTDAFLRDVRLASYYARVGRCIEGSIQVELALEFPHTAGAA